MGDALEDALCASFAATLECERLERQRFAAPVAARPAIFDFTEGWDHP